MATNRWYTNATNIIVDFTTAEAADVENKLDDVANGLDSLETEFDSLDERTLKVNPSGGETPTVEYTGTLANMKNKLVGFDSDGNIQMYPESTVLAWDGDIDQINLDGGTDIGAALADGDLILVDDGAGGTNRKSAISRLWTWIKTKTDLPLSMLDIDAGTDIGADLADADLLIVDDGASGTNRKSALSRVWTWIKTKTDLPLTMLDIDGGTPTGAALESGDLIIVDDGAGGTNRYATMAQVYDSVMDQMYTERTGLHRDNILINGNMEVNQQVISSRTSAGDLCDMWYASFNSGSTLAATFTVNTTAVSGFNSLANIGVEVTTAEASLNAATYAAIITPVEGYNCWGLGWGGATASDLTVAWSSKFTGLTADTEYTFCVYVKNDDDDRSYCTTYSFTTDGSGDYTGTFDVTIPGDTSGTWKTGTALGVLIGFSFAVGSTYLTTADTWSAGNYIGATGMSNIGAHLNATVQIADVRAVIGSNPTAWEPTTFGKELLLCKRYFQTSYTYGTSPISPGSSPVAGFIRRNAQTTYVMAHSCALQVPMRVTPTMAVRARYDNSYNVVSEYDTASAYVTGRAGTIAASGTSEFYVGGSGTLVTTAGYTYHFHYNADAQLI